MPDDTVFREKVEPAPEIPESALIEMTSDDIAGAIQAQSEDGEPKERVNALERWEMENGKYGVELFGIGEVVKEFPYKVHFGAIDNYIKSEIKERGWEPNTKNYQSIIEELQRETGTDKTETLSKLKKLYEYIQVVKKYNDLKKKKEQFAL